MKKPELKEFVVIARIPDGDNHIMQVRAKDVTSAVRKACLDLASGLDKTERRAIRKAYGCLALVDYVITGKDIEVCALSTEYK